MAAKKSFTDAINPAMQFITPPQAEAPTEATEPPAAAPATPRPSGPSAKSKAKAKKQPSGPKHSSAPEGYKPNPAYIEVKSRRLQLLMQPSLHDRIKARAAAEARMAGE